VLREIKKPNRDHARRLLQCLVVAIRPLRVEELAEVVAVDFDDAEGIPKLKPSWRWEDQEQALLTSCSSLITIVGTGGSRVVQFSHFSVKEFLTSARLSTSSQDVSRYHIVLAPAHTILAEVCLSIFLDNLIEDSSREERTPLAGYAAEHWVRHAQFEDVASHIKWIEYLFDLDKPYFSAWCHLHDMDTHPPYGSTFDLFVLPSKSGATPLYYAALCGFPNLVEKLIAKHPQHVNAIGGYYMTPAVAALAGRHFQLALALHHSGSSLEPRGDIGWSPLHSAVSRGDLEMVQVLLDYGVDVNALTEEDYTHCTL
jgi:Ankyrin repeats (3 copies)